MTFNEIISAIADQKFTRAQVEQIIIRALHSQEESVQNGINFQTEANQANQSNPNSCKLCGRHRASHFHGNAWCYHGEVKCPQGSSSRENWNQFNRRYYGSPLGPHQNDAYEAV